MPQNLGSFFFLRFYNSIHESICMCQILQLTFSLVALKIHTGWRQQFGSLQLQTFVKMKDTLNRAQNSKQSSHTQAVEKDVCESWQTAHTLWCTHCPFSWLSLCCPPHHTLPFIELSWFGCACRVWKGWTSQTIHFGCAPLAVKGADGRMPCLPCLGHISCPEKVFQQRFHYATFIFQDVRVSVNKHFEGILFTPTWRRKKCTPFYFLCKALERKRRGKIIVFRFQTSLPWALWSQQSTVGQVLCLLKALCN